jgi:hypothetical protein
VAQLAGLAVAADDRPGERVAGEDPELVEVVAGEQQRRARDLRGPRIELDADQRERPGEILAVTLAADVQRGDQQTPAPAAGSSTKSEKCARRRARRTRRWTTA